MTAPNTDLKRPGYFTQSEQGYLAVVDGLAPEEVRQVQDEAVAICRGRRGEVRIQGERIPVVDDEMSDEEVIEQFLCLHQVHKISDIIFQYLGLQTIRDVLTRVIGPNVKCMQSMLFVKSAGKPGQAWHQDEDYIPTRDRSLAGAWMALDDATIGNGCLWVIPGSHRHGILWPQYPHNDPRFDCAEEAYDFPYSDDDAVPVEVPAGAILFFNGYLLHRSLPNRAASGFRRVLVNHYMSAESYLPWHYEEGKAMARQDSRDIVVIAGEDPYAWKGTSHTAVAYVRADGKGGCGDGRLDLNAFKSQIGKANYRSG